MTSACPSDEALGALARRQLGGEETEHVQQHLDSCETCRATVIAAVRGGAFTQQPTEDAVTDVATRVPFSPLPPGSRIGRYEVRRLIGSGGMGHVYEAYDAELDRAIALKLLRPELSSNAAQLTERLRRESRLMARVVHPGVITVHDVGRDGDAVFIAMELVRGETLGAYISRAKPSWRDTVRMFERAGKGRGRARSWHRPPRLQAGERARRSNGRSAEPDHELATVQIKSGNSANAM